MTRGALGLLALVVLITMPASGAEPSIEAALTAIAQELVDSILPGDPRPWNEHLAEDFLLVDRDGTVLRKRDILDGMKPLPAGYTLTISIDEVEIRELGDTAVLLFKAIEDETLYGQALHVEYRNALTFAKREGAWKVVVYQYVEIPRDADPVPVDPAALDAIVGTYAMAPGAEYDVVRRGDRLFGARRGRAEAELVPESTDVFYVRGTEFRNLFLRDAEGNVTEMISRRKGSDTRWRRQRGD